MRRHSKGILIFVLVTLLLILTAQPALADRTYSVRVSPGEELEDDKYTVLSNTVEIRVRGSTGTEKVTIGNVEAEPKGRYWYFEDYPLSRGENKLTITVEEIEIENGQEVTKTYTQDLTIYYRDVAAPESRYRVADITEVNTIEAFGGEVVLRLGDHNAVMNSGRNRLADDQSIDITVYSEGARYRPNFIPASRLFEIRADSDKYSLLNEGQITLKYNTESFGAGLETLTVLWFQDYSGDPNRSVFENLGGVVDPENKTITVPLRKNGFGYYGVFNVSNAFNDFYMYQGKVSWSSTYVMPLYAKGIMNPLNPQTGSFGLLTWDGREQPTTQGEFATMLAKALQLPVDRIEPYNYDYDYNHYHYRYLTAISDPHVEAAARHGLLNGIPIGANNFISREQAAVMITRAANLKVYDDPNLISRINERIFTDAKLMSHWKQPYIYAAYRANLMPVTADKNQRNRFKFEPQQPLTRVQAAEMVYKLMKNREQNQ
ncbi:S-layer homology domain-containing protein [Desulfofalx alkaliphila]|uniref:S-layer homology domain-containing protein n=1 Tax=Desulfofalx alkaliphila TaxID=105483 RepID=UPI0004E238DE|nr:S-layer homology domain-containing protein [Desulfofalx alkaliphila]